MVGVVKNEGVVGADVDDVGEGQYFDLFLADSGGASFGALRADKGREAVDVALLSGAALHLDVGELAEHPQIYQQIVL